MRALIVLVVAFVAIVTGIGFGPVHLAPGEVIRALFRGGDDTTSVIVRQLRAPRALLAFAVGGSLSVTGAVLQVLVRNPLADSYLMGLSGGAGLGAVLAIAFGLGGAWGVPIAAFVGALIAVALVYQLAVVAGATLDARVLILAGVVVGSFASALVGAVVALSPATELRNAVLWLLGGFGAASWQAFLLFSLYSAVPLVFLFGAARYLDLLSLGDEPAGFLGVNVLMFKRLLYVVASLLTAAAVAVSGIVGFVGLVVPHATRLIWGHQHRLLLPMAFLVGGTLLTLADAAARTLFAPRELPVGVVTALIGVPVFAFLLRRMGT
jgi:iron complex transport system permease protein